MCVAKEFKVHEIIHFEVDIEKQSFQSQISYVYAILIILFGRHFHAI